MFLKHGLTVSQFVWDEVVRPNNWVTAIFCILLFIITMLLVTYRRRLLLIFRALFSQRHFSLVQREGKILENRGSVFLLLFNVLTITAGLLLFCTAYLPRLLTKLPFIANFGILFAVILAAYLLKLLCNELYSYLFGRERERASINQYKFIVMTDFSVVAFPLLLLVHYAGLQFVYYIIFAVLVILLFVWVYRLMKINSVGDHRFQFFLYFCTLEILPWVLFFKVLLIV
jgi:hypothetical protein